MTFHSPQLLWIIAFLIGILALGTGVRLALLHGKSDDRTRSHLQSVRCWWALVTLLAVALLFGHVGVAVLLAVAGIFSLREFLQIVGWNGVGIPTATFMFGVVPIYYLLLLNGHSQLLRSFAPIVILIALGAIRAWSGLIEDFIRTTAAMIWGLMLFVYSLSHAYFLLDLHSLPVPWIGELGWFLYLVLLTETNDIAQALIGRPFGRTKITPRTSPNKSLEGLCGGIAVTTLLAVLLAPTLTNFMQKSWSWGILLAVLSGLLIATFGFLGDLNKSGIKRDVGIKDSGTMLPGQGGIMDRVDSLTFSAPTFYYFLRVVLNFN